jgi:Cu/Ag efflux protein CusF
MKALALALGAAVGMSVVSSVPAVAQHGHGGEPMHQDGAAMPHGGAPMHGDMHAQQDAPAIEGTGVINSVDGGNRTVNLSHEPIAAIGWPSMTMDMKVADGVALSDVESGAAVTFTLERGADGIYMITAIDPAP